MKKRIKWSILVLIFSIIISQTFVGQTMVQAKSLTQDFDFGEIEDDIKDDDSDDEEDEDDDSDDEVEEGEDDDSDDEVEEGDKEDDKEELEGSEETKAPEPTTTPDTSEETKAPEPTTTPDTSEETVTSGSTATTEVPEETEEQKGIWQALGTLNVININIIEKAEKNKRHTKAQSKLTKVGNDSGKKNEVGQRKMEVNIKATAPKEQSNHRERGLEYSIRSDKKTVSVKIEGKEVNVVIPETVIISGKEYTVTHIRNTAIKHDTIIKDKLKAVARDDKEYEKNNKTETIQIPKTVISIETGSFSYFSKLKRITVASGNSKYKSTSKGLFSKDGTILYQAVNGTGTYKVPKAVKRIAARAFVATNYKKVILPDSCNEIGIRAFFKCKELKTIKENGLSKCGKYAFYGTKVKETDCYGTMKFKI